MTLADLKNTLLEVVNKFKMQKFTAVKMKDGSILHYEGMTPEIGMEIHVMNGQQMLPVPDGEKELEDGTILTVKQGRIIDVKKVQNVLPTGIPHIPPAMMSKFMEYLNSDSYRGENFNPAEYPWDQCVEEQKAKGVDCPECICAAIKNRTVKQAIEQGMAKTSEEAVELIGKMMNENKLFSYITNSLMKKEMDFATIEKKISELEASLKNQIEDYGKKEKERDERIQEMKSALEKEQNFSAEVMDVAKKILEMPSAEPAKPKDKFNKQPKDSLADFKEKYINK